MDILSPLREILAGEDVPVALCVSLALVFGKS
jgi:hypothetical protein